MKDFLAVILVGGFLLFIWFKMMVPGRLDEPSNSGIPGVPSSGTARGNLIFLVVVILLTALAAGAGWLPMSYIFDAPFFVP